MVPSLFNSCSDISNTVGPLATIYHIFQTKTTEDIRVPIELLIFCGLAMNLGLFTMGYKLMHVMGKKLTHFSPSKGFAAELSVSLTVITASAFGIPVSSTQCICGATAGVALSTGQLSALNWRMMGKIMGGWIITLPIAGSISALCLWISKAVL